MDESDTGSAECRSEVGGGGGKGGDGGRRDAKAASGSYEWAEWTLSIQDGCERACKYCFGHQFAGQYKRGCSSSWNLPTIRRAAVYRGYRLRKGTGMFPSTHDISPANLIECEIVLTKLLKAGNRMLVVSKPQLMCVKHLCRNLGAYRDQMLFRFTIGSADNAILRFWEPGAPLFEERLQALAFAHTAGFQTSVSCEPMLDLNIGTVIEAVRPHTTHSIWLGRVNNLRGALTMNYPDDKEARRRADELLASQTDDYLRSLYQRYKDDPLIFYKDSIKKAVGLARPTKAGLDV